MFKKSFYIGGAGNQLCRKEFSLLEKAGSAKIRIVADPHTYAKEYWQKLRNDGHDGGWLLGGSFLKYRIFVNGRLIGAGPARPVDDGIPPIHCFDVDLRQGKNVIGVFSRGEKKGFALQLHAELPNGEKIELHSNETWKMLNMDRCYSPVCWERQNIEQFFKGCAGPGEWAEHIDGTKYPFGWNDVGFNDEKWDNVSVFDPVTEHLDTREVRNYKIAKISPANITKIDKQSWLIDFGQEYIGGIELTGPEHGGSIELRLGEELMSDNHVRYQMRTENCYQEIWRFPNGGRTLSHFGLRSFRFLELIGYADKLENEMVNIISVTTPFNSNESSFSCSNSELKKVWELCKNTVAFTTMDVYNDCFSRERTAYEADSYVNMRSHFAVGSNTATAKRTIEYLVTHPNWPCEWQQFMIPLFYEYTIHTGDLGFVEQHYQKLQDQYAFANLISNGLIRKFPLEIIIDWPASCQDNYDFGDFCGVPNAFLYWNLVLLSKLAAILGKTVEQTEFIVLAKQVKTAFNHKLFDTETRLYIDSENSKHSSFHVNMFALRFGLVPEERIEKCLDFIIGKGMVCSVYGAQFYLDALFMYNRASEAVALMTANNDASWLGMIHRGATITTESWNPAQKANMSWAHPWAASPANIIVRHLFGLRPTAPGWCKYEFNPRPGGITSAKIKIHTPCGTLRASFRHDSGGRLIKEIIADNDSAVKASDSHPVTTVLTL
ncbi:MAG: family 78 glycoside hydrolase catalytic domain [Lentisphaeria bacterium]